MKIKLIAPKRKPEWGETFLDLKTLCRFTGYKAGSAPLALPTLAALTPSDVEVVLTDENVEPINFDEKVDLIGITGMSCVIPRSYEIADEYRKRGIPVVMGGIHVSMLPEEALQHCDSVVIGEAEEIWEHVVRDAENGRLQKFYRVEKFPDLTNSPIPRWDLLKNDKYSYFAIQTGRGCPYDCEFCSVQIFNGRQYRHKNIDRILAEVNFLKKIADKKPLFFVDDNILAIPKYAKEFFSRLIHYNTKWWCQASVNNLKNDQILDLMRKAGCREIFVGFESVSQESLNALRKTKVNKAEEYKDVIGRVNSYGMAVFGSFILGSDSDDKNTFDELRNFIEATNMCFAMINILSPPPGTKLYHRLKMEERLLTTEWWKYDGEHICFKSDSIIFLELARLRKRLLQDIYSYGKLYKRFQNMWKKGIFVKTKKGKLFTKGRIFVTLKIIFSVRIKAAIFILKCVWNKHRSLITPVLFAMNFHDYAFYNILDDDV